MSTNNFFGNADPYDKGWYATSAALIAAIPVGKDGYHAVVGATDSVWVWDSGTSAWKDTGVSGAGGLLAANNLSDVVSKPTSRTNLQVAQLYISTVLPTKNNDGVDTAGLGRTFATGDVWVVEDNATSTYQSYRCSTNLTGAAIWNEVDGAEHAQYFGDGSDGDVTINSAVSLSRTTYYNNLTLDTGAALNVNRYRVFVKNILDISSAPTGAIFHNGNPGGSTVGSSAGTQAGAQNAADLAAVNRGNIGVVGGTTTGAQPTQLGASTQISGGTNTGAFGGKGGNGSSGAGGAAMGNLGTIVSWPFRILDTVLVRGSVLLAGGFAGESGSSGGGDGVTGGGSGAGGNGGLVLQIYARVIKKGTNTNPAIFQARGGDGGNAGTPAAGNRGGGGGGAGGAGGFIYLVYEFLTGSTITGALDVSGGNGGNGGNGTGTGTPGDGGYSGAGGVVVTICTATGVITSYTDGAAVANVGITGGVPIVARVDL